MLITKISLKKGFNLKKNVSYFWLTDNDFLSDSVSTLQSLDVTSSAEPQKSSFRLLVTEKLEFTPKDSAAFFSSCSL